jgi:hypothetical protein
MRPEELSRAFDDIQGIGKLVDETFQGQVEQEIATLQQVTGRVFTESEQTALHATLHQAMTAIWAEVAFTHPHFKQVALELSKEGAAKLGIA